MLTIAQCMRELHAMDCSFVPCGGNAGKKPLIKWTEYQDRLPTVDELADWQNRYSESNVGIVTGALSGVTVIDSDNPNTKTDYLQEIFGETPLIVSTPRGGIHLYYRHCGEGNRTGLQFGDGLKVDVRGSGGIVVAPPSKNPHSHKSYEIIEGSYKYIKDLPLMKAGALDFFQHTNPAFSGGRNNTLFLQLKDAAIHSASLDALLDLANHINRSFNTPLSFSELNSTAKSVWRMKEKGKIFNKGDSFVRIYSEHILSIGRQNADALFILCDLQHCHGYSAESFAVSPPAYAKRIQRSVPTIKKALRYLVHQGTLTLVHSGGSRKGDTNLYRLAHSGGKNLTPI